MLTFTLMVLALGAISHHVLNAQQAPPTERKGQTVKTLASLDLGPEMAGLQGLYLRARVITFEPGGHGILHNHKDRPNIVYVLQGTFTECKPDGTCTEIHEGQAKTEGKHTVHWPENRGTKPLVLLVVEITNEP
jgi:quercetin dioxygenase-like cupin family protein